MTDRLATKKALNVLDNELTDAMLDFAKTLNIIHEDIYDRMSKQDKQINLLQVQIRHLLKTHGFAYLYVLYNPTRKEYKIGHSQSPYQRQRLFQSLDPDISLVLMIALESAHQARTLEKLLHYHFQDKNTHGEWFDLNEDDIDFIRLFELLAVAS